MIKTGMFLIVVFFALFFFGRNVRRLVSYLRIGQQEDITGDFATRVKRVLSIAFGQKKLLREPLAGWMHFFIFWGFIILLSAILEALLEGFGSNLSFAFLGPLYSPLAFMQDLFGILVTLAVATAFFRRNIIRVKRLEFGQSTGSGHRHSSMDANLILGLIFLIMVSMFLQNATHIALQKATGETDSLNAGSRFLTSIIADHVSRFSPATLSILCQVFWWTHILIVLGFLNYLPYSKHLHIGSSFFNVYFSSLKPRGNLKPINLDSDNVTKFGAGDVEESNMETALGRIYLYGMRQV